MNEVPLTVVADKSGAISDWPALLAAGRSGRAITPLDPNQLIPLPEGSRLYLLPKRHAIGYTPAGTPGQAKSSYSAVAAFLPPGYVATSLAAFEPLKSAPTLPLFCYAAVCWYRNAFYVAAVRVDHDPKHHPSCADIRTAHREVGLWLKKYPTNRLLAHHGLVCVKHYGCPNAINLFLKRWEAPIAVSGGCNASCQGCISKQEPGPVHSPQERISFVPTVDEILEIAVPHLKKAPRAIVSFGQGCEGEPLLQGELIEAAIRAIRKQTKRGTLHLNTNGSLPLTVKRLAAAGLDSIRISLNSARPELYAAYYQAGNYTFNDVIKTFAVAREAGLWISINYLTFPGVTDDKAEFQALNKMLKAFTPNMIQWRNLNIDPDAYMDTVDRAVRPISGNTLGIQALMHTIRTGHPALRFGYFNPPVAEKPISW